MTQKFIRTLAWSALAGAIAAVLISLGAWAVERSDASPRKLLTGDIRVVKGTAEAVDSGLTISGVDSEGVAMLIEPLGLGVPSRRYAAMRWSIEAGGNAQGYALIWVTAAEPQTLQSLPLTRSQFFSGRVEISADPRWTGDIAGVGIAVLGPTELPMMITTMELDPTGASWSWIDSARYWAGRLIQFEPWLPSSINFYRGSFERSLISPTTLVVGWVALSILIVAGISWATKQFAWSFAVGVITVLGWLILDFRWSIELVNRMRSPAVDVTQYASADAERWLEQLSALLGQTSTRVFLIDQSPSGAKALRARYLLSPHATQLGFSDIPDGALLRPGDVIVVLSSPVSIHFDTKKRRLFSGSGRSIAASMISRASGVGFAFIVDEASKSESSP